ncbi:hypothetical protein L873DRAFT_1786778 [Choiromyces venosus 120613-1]|uniref:Uncharacterized protein n=1 Tax=Choiromyces venosus 120613-1 TaxID=1336337 RepID=A0A3N4K2Q4_9PEZI|nr:hypothetical protein L873DRAFT_1786778 [Choiromyces venosus 120613-1]
MPAILTRSLTFLKRSSTLPKSPAEENRASTAYEIDEFLRCLPPSPPTPPSAPHNHHTFHHSPIPSTSSTLSTSAIILPPSPPPTDVPPVPPPSYNSLEKGYYNSSACASSLPHVRVHCHEQMPIQAHVQEAQSQHQRSSSREKNLLLNLRVETDLDFGGRSEEPVLVYQAPIAVALEEPRVVRQEEIIQWSWI